MKRKASISHDKAIVDELRRDPKFAAEYLKAALEDADEPQVLLIVLRHLAEAKGGVAKIAKAAGIKRESLYRALSERGNPRTMSSLTHVEPFHVRREMMPEFVSRFRSSPSVPPPIRGSLDPT